MAKKLWQLLQALFRLQDKHCECLGCCDSHPPGLTCTDTATVVVCFAGDVARAMCVECVIEVAKGLL